MALWVWFVCATIALGLSLPVIYLGRRRAEWFWPDILVLIVPFVFLILLTELFGPRTTVAGVTEPFLLFLSLPLLAPIRVLVRPRVGRALASFLFTLLATVAATLIFLLTPLLLRS